MRDLDAIDRQLRELGEPPRDRASLLASVLGADRSRDRLEALLAGLGAEAAAPMRPPPRAEPAPEQRVPDERVPDERAIEASDDERDELRDTDLELTEPAAIAAARESEAPDAPQRAPSSAPPRAADDGTGFAALFDFTNPPPPRDSMADEVVSARGPEPQPDPESPFDAPPRDTPVDPEPDDDEKTARRSAPPAPQPLAAADDDSDAEEEDFELLVDDEDIIEIGEDEMQIVEDD